MIGGSRFISANMVIIRQPLVVFRQQWQSLVVLILIKFLWETPLFIALYLTRLGGRGTDTVSVGFLAGNCPNGSTEKRVGLQLCLLASTLCRGFGSRIYLARFLEMRAAPSKVGWVPSLLIRPGLPQNVCQLSTKTISFAEHHLDSQQLSDDMQLNISSLVKLGFQRKLQCLTWFWHTNTLTQY